MIAKMVVNIKYGRVSVFIALLYYTYVPFSKIWEILKVKLALSMICSLLWETSRSTLKNPNV